MVARAGRSDMRNALTRPRLGDPDLAMAGRLTVLVVDRN